MAVDANTVETYDNTLIREDLQEAFSMISPEEVPFTQSAGTKAVSQPKFDWPTMDLADPVSNNRVVEGDDAPGIDAATLGVRWENVTQISDKVVSVSHTSEATDAAANNVQRLMSQVSIKLREMKRDMEIMLLSNTAMVEGSSGNARTTAGLQAWIATNSVDGGAGAADPVFSGPGGYGGHPSTAAVEANTQADIDEDTFNDLIEACWTTGASPSMVLVNGKNKRAISQTFTGTVTRYQGAPEKEITNAIDFYDTDFGRMSIVPTRFLPTLNAAGDDDSYSALVLDSDYYKIAYLDNVQRKPLAETGHSMKTLIWAEYGLQVDNEKALGIYRDTTNTYTP